MFKRFLSLFVLVGAVLSSTAVFAQGGSPTIDTDIVSWSGVGTAIITALGTPFLAMIGIGLSFAVAYAGYKFIRYRAM
jgi:hypothetical protein